MLAAARRHDALSANTRNPEKAIPHVSGRLALLEAHQAPLVTFPEGHRPGGHHSAALLLSARPRSRRVLYPSLRTRRGSILSHVSASSPLSPRQHGCPGIDLGEAPWWLITHAFGYPN